MASLLPRDPELRALEELRRFNMSSSQRAIVLTVAIHAYDGISLSDLRQVIDIGEATLRSHLRALEASGFVRFLADKREVWPGSRIQRQHEAVAR